MSETTVELTGVTQPEAVAVKPDLPSATRSATGSSARSLARKDESDASPANGTADDNQRSITVTSKGRTTVIIASVTLITTISTLLNGLTTVALPTIARELDIPEGLVFWPTSIQALTTGCTLLICGSLADALGSRFMYLTGSVLQAGMILGCGLSQTSAQLILFRGLSGIALSFCLPSVVSIITASFVGKRRNIAFATMGGGQPIGFAIGLVLGGVLTGTIGWRWGFHLSAILDIVIVGVAIWGLPKEIDNPPGTPDTPASRSWSQCFARMKTDIDWIGAIIASASLALLSYALATITGETSDIREPSTIATLVVAIALIPVFIYWMHRREHITHKPALIPNSLWRNNSFTAICLAVFLTWGAFNSIETLLTFFFQDVQDLSAIQTSLRFLPTPVAGIVWNVLMGALVHKVKANYLVIGGCTLSLIAPLVMVPTTPESMFWKSAFLANIFSAAGADALFTSGNLVITSVFPDRTQALAGGVFYTISQIGKSVGLVIVAVIASSVTSQSSYEDEHSPEALLEGYHAGFWFIFAITVATIGLCLWGLRGIGKVGHKQD